MPRPKNRKSTGSSKSASKEELYEVQKVVDYHEEDGVGKWRIRWKGYSASDDTWEPVDNIITEDKKINEEMERLKTEYEEAQEPAKPKAGKAADSAAEATKAAKGAPKRASSLKRSSSSISKEKEKEKESSGKGGASAAAPTPKVDPTPKKAAAASPSATPKVVPPAAASAKIRASAKRPAAAVSSSPAKKVAPAKTSPAQSPSLKRQKLAVEHVRRYTDRDDDFECTLKYDDSSRIHIPASVCRVQYPQQLLDYLFKRLKFVDNSSSSTSGGGAVHSSS